MQAKHTADANKSQQVFSRTHSFDVEFARIYGVEEAVLINTFIHWIDYNRQMGVNYIDGRTWMYQTQEEIASRYPYWNRRQILRIIKSLVDQGVLISDNHSKDKWHKTQWYALKNEGIFTNVTELTTEGQALDYGRSNVGQSYIGKDTKKEDTKKETAARIEIRPASLAFAAASSSSELSQQQEIFTPLKAVSSKEQPSTPVHPCLIDVDIPTHEKEWLTKAYSLPVVERSVAWACHPTTRISTTLQQALKWFCGQNEENRPKSPLEQKAIKEKEEKEKAQELNKKMITNGKLALKALSVFYSPQGGLIKCYPDHMAIYKYGIGECFVIEYDKYSLKDFSDVLQKELKERGFILR